MEYKGNQNESALYQEADVSSKRIFGNHTLCAQFLRDYSGLPMLANVQPEDIEDVSERYHLFREVELQADTVKKVHLKDQADGKGQDIYIISLIPASNEPSAVLARAFGECREGQIPRSSAALQV